MLQYLKANTPVHVINNPKSEELMDYHGTSASVKRVYHVSKVTSERDWCNVRLREANWIDQSIIRILPSEPITKVNCT